MKLTSLIAAAAMTLAPASFAQSSTDHSAHHGGAASAAAASAMADGEVRKVDTEQGRLTLKHGPIASLDMPGMTMVFRVADPKMLDNLKQGDRVKFAAENKNGAITVTAIELAK